MENDDEDDTDSDDSAKGLNRRRVIKIGIKKIKISTTDEEAGYYYRDEKEKTA